MSKVLLHEHELIKNKKRRSLVTFSNRFCGKLSPETLQSTREVALNQHGLIFQRRLNQLLKIYMYHGGK